MLSPKRSFLTKLILCYIDSTPRHSFHIFTYSTSSANLIKWPTTLLPITKSFASSDNLFSIYGSVVESLKICKI